MTDRAITEAELRKNNGENGKLLWVLIHNNIYDVTNFEHPGGPDAMLEDHGDDRGHEFDSIHSPATKTMMKQYLIGQLAKEDSQTNTNEHKKTDGDKKLGKKDEKQNMSFVPFIIIAVVVVAVAYKFLL